MSDKQLYTYAILKRLRRRMQQKSVYILQRMRKKKLPPYFGRVAAAYGVCAYMLSEEMEVLDEIIRSERAARIREQIRD